MKIKYMIVLLAFAPLLASESSAQQAATPAELAATEQVKQKLNNIIIPELNNYDLPLTDCVKVLRTYAQKLDPEPDVNRKGVNIVIHGKPGEPDIGERKIKRLMLRNVSLGEALKHVCTATGVSYKVDGNIVVITPGLAPDQQAATPAELAATEQVKQKLNHIIIPELNNYDLTLIDCVKVFRIRAQQFDPEPDVNRKGVNFVIHSRPGEPDIGERKIKRLMLRNVSLGDALKHVCTATGVAYKVDGNIVVICDAPKN